MEAVLGIEVTTLAEVASSGAEGRFLVSCEGVSGEEEESFFFLGCCMGRSISLMEERSLAASAGTESKAVDMV